MKNAWERARTPGDYLAATTGTIIFTSMNLTNDFLDFRQKQVKWASDRLGVKDWKVKIQLPSGNFFGR